MIAKHVMTKHAGRSGYVKLVKYMIAPQSKHERVGTVTVTNCESLHAEAAALEVLNTQLQNRRAKSDKTYHLVVSFPRGESPDAKVLLAIEERLCSALGFGEHQRVSAVHHDTDHLHIHIAINKIHPTRYTLHEPFNAYHTIGKVCLHLEEEFGLLKTEHAAKKTKSENRAKDLEHQSKVESLLGWVKRECSDSLRKAASWEEVHEVLSQHGLSIKARTNGLVIVSAEALMVKASSIGREFSKAALEARMGKFFAQAVPAKAEQSKKRYTKAPKSSEVDTSSLYACYTKDYADATVKRADAWSRARARKDQAIDAAKRAGRRKRTLIKTMATPGITRKALYAATSKTLRDEIARAHQTYRSERQSVFQAYKRQSWAEWLRQQAGKGDADALRVLRERSEQQSRTGNCLYGTSRNGECPPLDDGTLCLDSVTMSGTLIYTVGACAIRDSGTQIDVGTGADLVAAQAALRMALARYGTLIAVNGSNEFREQIAQAAAASNLDVRFDDRALEQRRLLLKSHFTTKEKQHGHNSTPGRTDRHGAGQPRSDQSGINARAGASEARDSVSNESGFGGPRQAPPPQSRNGVRELSQLGMVRVAQGSEMLLPGDVPDHMEHGRPQPDHQLRRRVRGEERLERPAATAIGTGKPKVARAGTAPPPASRGRLQPLNCLGKLDIGSRREIEAPRPPLPPGPLLSPAGKYVFEREQTRRKASDIPKHSQYSFVSGGEFSYGGLRVVDGQSLALLGRDGEISVLAVDQATADRLRRLRLGQQLKVSATGVIRVKGRAR